MSGTIDEMAMELRDLVSRNEKITPAEQSRIQFLAKTLPREFGGAIFRTVADLQTQEKARAGIALQRHKDLGSEMTQCLTTLCAAISDADTLTAAKRLRDILRERDAIVIPGNNRGSRLNVLSNALAERPKDIKDIDEQSAAMRQGVKESVRKAKVEAIRLRDERATEEYAAMLAEGRKFQTLQQAYANGDFLPVATNTKKPSVRSNTGHRLRSRG